MTAGFADFRAASRRLALLRLLVELGDPADAGSAAGATANETVIAASLRQHGYREAARADIAGDLDHLAARGAIAEEYVGDVRIAILRERGEDIAHGRVTIDGVEHALWRRK